MSHNWRSSREARIWRVRVIRRDSVCQVPGCGSRKGRQAHHINSASYFPDERFDEENGIVFCKGCHMNFHTNFKRSYRQKCTRYDLDNFMALTSYLNRIHAQQSQKGE